MKAILMAAGVGSRISEFIDCPKSVLDVEGVPLIAHTVDMLLSKGVQVAVVLGFKREYIVESLEGRNVTYFYNPFFRITNSIASLWFARDFIGDDEIILANADVFWGEEIYEELVSDKRPVVMLGDESRVENGDYFFNVVDGRIVKYGKGLERHERNTEYVGIAKMTADSSRLFVNRLDEMIGGGSFDLWWEDVLYSHISESPVYVRDVSRFFWAEIDYISDYSRILAYVRTGDVSCKKPYR